MTVKRQKTVLDLNASDACIYFLKNNNYCNNNLPDYYDFENILKKCNIFIKKNEGAKISIHGAKKNYNTNYKIYKNKNGNYSWRKIQLIHPVIYVSLVNEITEKWDFILERFKKFNKVEKIECLSIPVISKKTNNPHQQTKDTILTWWNEFEQKSIELSLEFQYIISTDISGCYDNIYTHSIAWALHGKDTMKKPKNRNDKKLIGNIIDAHIQSMAYGQTNGIPQGSILMDFIAEMLLGYADRLLSCSLKSKKIKNYKILRNRDDYRIFADSELTGHKILKLLTEILMDLGLQLNSNKTFTSDDLITSSIKKDKLYRINNYKRDKNLQKQLLIIQDLAQKHPNSGSLKVVLTEYNQRLKKLSPSTIKLYHKYLNIPVLVSLIINIAYKNSNIHDIATITISILFNLLTDISDPSPTESLDQKKLLADQKRLLIEKIQKKFKTLPHTDYWEIWLQRATFKVDDIMNTEYENTLCRIFKEYNLSISSSNDDIWNSEWIAEQELKNAMKTSIINKTKRDELSEVANPNEVNIFPYY